MVELKEINEDNFNKCLKLKVDGNQKSFVAENSYSLAQAWLYPKNARPFAIYNGDEIIGFMMLDIDYHCDGSQRTCGLWRLMIDEKHQGKGYGKAAMQSVIDYVKKTFNPKEFRTSIVPGNEIAENLYKNLGFMPTGEMDGGEIVMLLKF